MPALACDKSAREDGTTGEFRLFGGPLFVGGGAVEGGHREVVEAEVDAELGDVVDHVVEEEAAEHGGARAFADELLAEAEAPGSHEGFVGGGGQRGAALGSGVVEC